jgi:hypothetical protein
MNPNTPNSRDNIPSDPEPNNERLGSIELQNVVKDVMKNSKLPYPVLSHREQLARRAALITKSVHETFMKKHSKLDLIPMTKQSARDELYPDYKDHYRTWSHEDLVEYVSLLESSLHGESMHNHLI